MMAIKTNDDEFSLFKRAMEKLDLNLDDGSSLIDVEQIGTDDKNIYIEKCMQALEHAYRCKDANCQLEICEKIKCIIIHTKICPHKNNNGDCYICKSIFILYRYHAEHCQNKKCPLKFCHNNVDTIVIKFHEVNNRMENNLRIINEQPEQQTPNSARILDITYQLPDHPIDPRTARHRAFQALEHEAITRRQAHLPHNLSRSRVSFNGSSVFEIETGNQNNNTIPPRSIQRPIVLSIQDYNPSVRSMNQSTQTSTNQNHFIRSMNLVNHDQMLPRQEQAQDMFDVSVPNPQRQSVIRNITNQVDQSNPIPQQPYQNQLPQQLDSQQSELHGVLQQMEQMEQQSRQLLSNPQPLNEQDQLVEDVAEFLRTELMRQRQN